MLNTNTNMDMNKNMNKDMKKDRNTTVNMNMNTNMNVNMNVSVNRSLFVFTVTGHGHTVHIADEATLSVDFESIKQQFAFKIEYLSDKVTLSLVNVEF